MGKSEKYLDYLNRRGILVASWIQDRVEKEGLPAGRFPISDGIQYSILRLSSRQHQLNLWQILNERNQNIDVMLKRIGIFTLQLQPGEEVKTTIFEQFRCVPKHPARHLQRMSKSYQARV